MCGIAGVFHYRREGPVDPFVLRDMAAAITHRGPDDEGFYESADHRLGFGFRRLSIVDLAGGHQPMATPDGRYHVVYNGEIYNHLDLRRELESRGAVFRTRCDTEVLLHAYAAFGPGFVTRLQGMFALAIWDEKERTLLLARDRVGIKPLYYAVRGGAVCFASEIKAILAHPEAAPGLNRAAMASYLTFMCLPAPQTLFEGVHKLRAGHTLLWKDGGEEPEPVRYWSPLPEPGYEPPDRDEDDVAEELRELLRDSVRARLMADVPFGAFLSGGVDSSSIVSIMSSVLDRPVETFSVGYRNDPGFNEFQHARRTAELFGTNHHEVLIDHEDFRHFLPRLVHHQDEPIADPVCVPLYYVAELARQNGVIVTLVGEGADELFFGYAFHDRVRRMYERFWRPMSAAPGVVRNAATRAAGPLVDVQRRDFLRRLREGGEPFWGGSVAFYPEELRRVAPALAADPAPGRAVESLYAEYDRVFGGAIDFPNRVGYLELMFRLPELLLMRVDKMTMAASVEGRVPFLDHRVVELAFRIPGSMKVRGDVRKHILKKAVAPLLPAEIVNRPKVGFHVPVTRWFEQVLGPMAEELLLDPELLRLELWDARAVRDLLARGRAGRGNVGMRIWTLVNFALWYRHWMGGGARARPLDAPAP